MVNYRSALSTTGTVTLEKNKQKFKRKNWLTKTPKIGQKFSYLYSKLKDFLLTILEESQHYFLIFSTRKILKNRIFSQQNTKKKKSLNNNPTANLQPLREKWD